IAAVMQQCPKIVRMWFLNTPLNSAEFSKDGRFIVAAGADGTATLYDLARNSEVSPWIGGTNELESASFSNDGKFVITTGAGFAEVMETVSKKRVLSLAPRGTVYTARFSPDGTQIVTASGGDTE